METLTPRTHWFYQTIRTRNPQNGEPASSGLTGDRVADNATLVTARALGDIHGPVLIRDSVGPRDTDHYFVFSLGALDTLVTTLGTANGVSGLQVIRGVSTGGAIDPGEVLATCSTLIHNPVTIRCSLDAASYFVRIYHIAFGDHPYDLTLAVGRVEEDQAPGSAADPLTLGRLSKPRRKRHARGRRAVLAASGCDRPVTDRRQEFLSKDVRFSSGGSVSSGGDGL
jgi:hypothetical protein